MESDSAQVIIRWNEFCNLVIDDANPQECIIETDNKLLKWNVEELNAKRQNHIKVLFHSTDSIPKRILDTFEFTGYRYDPIPSIPKELRLPY